MNIAKKLHQPFPQIEQNWATIIAISCFVGLFILVFQPFGLSHLQGPVRHIILAGYGLITFICLSINLAIVPSLLKKQFQEQTWNLKKHILFFSWILFTIGLGNYFYTLATTDFFEFNLLGFFLFQAYTLAVGLFPVVFLSVFTQNQLYKKNLKSATEVNMLLKKDPVASLQPPQQVLEIPAQGKKSMQIDPSALLYIEAMGNYIRVHFLKEEKHKNEVLRCSLKDAQKAIQSYAQLLRCHRTYIVNASKIKQASGNAQGYTLRLKGTGDTVPVSRKYIPHLKDYLKNSAASPVIQ